MILAYIGVILFSAFIFLILVPGIKIIAPGQKGVVTKLGKFQYTLDVGKGGKIYFVFPLVYKLEKLTEDEYKQRLKSTVICPKCNAEAIPFDSETCPYCNNVLKK